MAGKQCHGGILQERRCHVPPGDWRRVCGQCLSEGDITLPAERCWLLMQPLGSFSTGRSYYVQWNILQRVVAQNVRPFTLIDGTVLLIFASAEEAVVCASTVPPGVLLPAGPEHRTLKMCSTAKSYCPAANFIAAPGVLVAHTSCVIHLPSRGSNRLHPASQQTQTTTALPLQRQPSGGLQPSTVDASSMRSSRSVSPSSTEGRSSDSERQGAKRQRADRAQDEWTPPALSDDDGMSGGASGGRPGRLTHALPPSAPVAPVGGQPLSPRMSSMLMSSLASDNAYLDSEDVISLFTTLPMVASADEPSETSAVLLPAPVPGLLPVPLPGSLQPPLQAAPLAAVGAGGPPGDWQKTATPTPLATSTWTSPNGIPYAVGGPLPSCADQAPVAFSTAGANPQATQQNAFLFRQ